MPENFEKPSNLKIWIRIIFALVIAGYLIIANYSGWWPFAVGDERLATGDQEQQEQMSDELAGWQTYCNEEFGFEVEYPAEWKVNEQMLMWNKLGDRVWMRIDVFEDIVYPDITFDEALSLTSGREFLPILNVQDTNINGLRTRKTVEQLRYGKPDPFANFEPFLGTTRTVVEYNYLGSNDLYRLKFQIDDNEPDKDIAIFDQIAKSFHLIVGE